jgi:hypothetical protein
MEGAHEVIQRTPTAALILSALSFVAVVPASANPERSHGVATACWSGGELHRVKIGHEPQGGACASNQQEIKLWLQDIPNMRVRDFNVRGEVSNAWIGQGHGNHVLLIFEGFFVEAGCFYDGETEDAFLSVYDPMGMPRLGLRAGGNSSLSVPYQYLDPELAAAVGKEVGTMAILKLEDVYIVPASQSNDGYCYYSGRARIIYTDEAMNMEDWSTLETEWNQQ